MVAGRQISLNKRVRFLDEVVKQLKLDNVKTVIKRAEEGARDEALRGRFDFCVCRAVAAMPVLAELCLPYVKAGGYFLAMKGAECGEELQSALRAVEALGGGLPEIKEVYLPHTDNIKRSVIMIKKVRQTPHKYPRMFAQITKNPIK
jgi:16S rRNA (guanine527-N7)-methyltransferase